MKKKLLSLVLAGAMVASTSVSAFAATEDATYNIDSTKPQNHKVTITGDIANKKNETLPGTITVTIPSAMAFTVDKDGKVTGGKIEVVNRSSESVEVVAEKFNDTTPDNKIVLVKKTELDSKIEAAEAGSEEGKTYMTLDLIGNTNTLGLVSSKVTSESGFVKNSDESPIQAGENTTLGNAVNGINLELKLEGNAKHSDSSQHAYSAPTTAVNDTFNLILKIQKTK